jgi:general stress protein YciG
MADKGHKGKQGCASMDPEKAREARRRGGQTTQRLGKAHALTQEEVQKGGKKGGLATSQNRTHMSEIGRKGGVKSRRGRSKAKDQNRKEQ